MSDCFKCVYHLNIPHNAHISCRYNWLKQRNFAPPIASEHGIEKGWYFFPLNFDPIWQQEDCKAFSTTIDQNYFVEQFDPISILFSILK